MTEELFVLLLVQVQLGKDVLDLWWEILVNLGNNFLGLVSSNLDDLVNFSLLPFINQWDNESNIQSKVKEGFSGHFLTQPTNNLDSEGKEESSRELFAAQDFNVVLDDSINVCNDTTDDQIGNIFGKSKVFERKGNTIERLFWQAFITILTLNYFGEF